MVILFAFALLFLCCSQGLGRVPCIMGKRGLLYDPYFTTCLTLLKSHIDGDIYPLPHSILDRFCSQILPEIHHEIEWLHLEPSSMQYILLSTNYPNLYKLTLYNIEVETAKYFFIGKKFYFEIFQ